MTRRKKTTLWLFITLAVFLLAAAVVYVVYALTVAVKYNYTFGVEYASLTTSFSDGKVSVNNPSKPLTATKVDFVLDFKDNGAVSDRSGHRFLLSAVGDSDNSAYSSKFTRYFVGDTPESKVPYIRAVFEGLDVAIGVRTFELSGCYDDVTLPTDDYNNYKWQPIDINAAFNAPISEAKYSKP